MEIDEIARRTFPISRRGYERADVDAFLLTIAAEYQEILRSANEAVRAAEDKVAASSGSQSFENVGSHVASILATASQAAENLKDEAEREAYAVRAAAEEEAAELKRVAEAYYVEAKGLRGKAEQEAADLRSAARSDVDAMIAAARDEALQIEQEGRDEAARLERVSRANVEAIVAEGRRDYEHMRSLQQQSIDRLSSVEFLIRQAKDGISGQLQAGDRAVSSGDAGEVGPASRRIKFRRTD